MQLVVGPFNDEDCNITHMAFHVDGKVLGKSITINEDDIESIESGPPNEEFPNGWCDIKLKNNKL